MHLSNYFVKSYMFNFLSESVTKGIIKNLVIENGLKGFISFEMDCLYYNLSSGKTLLEKINHYHSSPKVLKQDGETIFYKAKLV